MVSEKVDGRNDKNTIGREKNKEQMEYSKNKKGC